MKMGYFWGIFSPGDDELLGPGKKVPEALSGGLFCK